MPEPRPLLQQVERYRAALTRQDEQALGRLTDAYRRIYRRLQDKISLLIDQIAVDQPTRGQVVRMERYRALIAQIENELRDFQALTHIEMERQGIFGINQGSHDAQTLMNHAAEWAGIRSQFNKLPTDTIEALLGFLDPDGVLFREKLGYLGTTTAQRVADTIVEGVGLGYNPRKIADQITDSLGMGLTDALRMTRTVQLWSYREATRANFIANADIITGWIWCAELGPDTCMSCIAMHGTEHPLDEALDDHFNGRCAAIPIVADMPNPIEETGEQWFDSLGEVEQRAMMGAGKYDAWKAGKFALSDITGTYQDAAYGSMRIEKPLKDLVHDD